MLTFRGIIEEVERRGLSQSEIARIIDADPSFVHKVLKQQRSPAFDTAIAMLEKLGWKFDRADPDVEVVPEVPGQPLQVLGSVSAGAVRITEEQTELIDDPGQVFEKSRFWARGLGPVRYLKVDGDSMEPDYPKDSLIAVRKTTLKAKSFEDLSPVIFKNLDTHEYAFKLIQVEKKWKSEEIDCIVGLPINRTHRAIVFKPPDMVRIEFVVVGQIQVAGPSSIPSVKNAGVLIAREEGIKDTTNPNGTVSGVI